MDDVAWAAGLFEGEGCFSFRRDPRYNYSQWTAKLSMKDEDIVRRFHAVVGVGTVTYADPPSWRRAGHVPMWLWRVGSREGVRHVVDLLSPLLGARRLAQIERMYASGD